MRIYIFLSFIIFDCNCYCKCCFIEKESNFISSLSHELMITHIVMVNRTCEISNKISELKYYSLKNINIGYMNLTELIEFLSSKYAPNTNMIIVLKIVNAEELQSLSQQLNNKFEQIRILSAFKWMLLLPQNTEIMVTEKNFYVPFDCQYFLARELENGYEIFEIYQIKKTTNMIYTHFGIWDNKHGLNKTSIYFYNTRKDMKGVEIIISTYLIGRKCEFIVQCIHIKMMTDLANMLNYTEVFVNVSEVGKAKPDIEEQVTFLNYFNPKKDYVVGPLTICKWHFYIKHEIDKSQGWLSYFKPFGQDLWLTTALWLIIASFIKVIIVRNTMNVKLKNYTLLDQGLVPLTAFCNQGIFYGPETASTRIARISTLLVSGVVVPAYSAAVISSLTVVISKIPFTNFDTFVQDGTYQLSAVFHPVVMALFKNSESPVMKIIREKYLVPVEEFCRRNEDCVETICKKEKISITAFNYKLTQYPAKCRIFRIPSSILDLYTGIELGEGISYKRIMTEAMFKYRSSGIYHRYQTIIYGEKHPQIEDKFQAIDIDVVLFTFAILIAGFLLSWFVLICEISWHNCRMHQQQQQEGVHSLPYGSNSDGPWKKNNRKRLILGGRYFTSRIDVDD